MTNCELLFTKLLVNRSTYLTIITCYRPPNNDYNIFINELTDILLEYLYRTIILTGDFNFHFDTDKHPHSDCIDHYNQFNLHQHNCFPIHIHACHTLDLIFTTLESLLMIDPPTNSTLITDHYAIDCIININTPKVIRKITYFRNLKTINFTQFSVDIIDSLYSTLTSIPPFHNVCTLLFNKHAPLTNKHIPTHTTTPWLSIELGILNRLVRKKNIIYNKCPTEYNHSQLSLNRNIYLKLLKKIKSNYLK